MCSFLTRQSVTRGHSCTVSMAITINCTAFLVSFFFFFFLLQLEGRVLTPYINPLGMSQCPIFGVPFAATHCAVDLCNALIAGQELI